MRLTNLGSNFNVAVSEEDIDHFNSRWPASELRGLRGVTFQFDKGNGDLIDIWYKNGDSDRWDGPALTALSEDAQKYGEKRLKTTKDNPSRMPDNGYAISSDRSGYDSYHLTKGEAVRAARVLAEKVRKPIEIVRITDHGNRRYIVGEVEPPGWSNNPAAWAKVFG